MDIISEAARPSDYDAFGALLREYVEWCRERHRRDYPWLMEMAFDHQSLDKELTNLAGKYGPPTGKVLLARRDGQASGAVAYQTIKPNICEMKRLFVPERFLGNGIGRHLCQALIDHAAADGFTLMRLDTGILFREAIALYRSLGFVECEPYNHYPEKMMPLMVFLERPLA